jgi:mercuric ion transport protein
MNDRSLMWTGSVGAAIAAICCATPVLALVLPLVGLGAWLAAADYVLIPLLLVCLSLLGLGLYRSRCHAGAPARTVKNT